MTERGDWSLLTPMTRYADACDHREWRQLDEVFVDDAVGEYGGTVLQGRAAITGMIRSMLEGCGPTQHLLGNQSVTVDGDRATTSCRVRATHHAPDDPTRAFEIWGRYLDDLRRTPAGWRIARRRLIVDHRFGDRTVLAPRPAA